MDAWAFGKRRIQKKNILATGAECRIVPRIDGSVDVTFDTEDPFGAKGQYEITVAFSAEEISALYRKSIVGEAVGSSEVVDSRRGSI